MDIISFYHLTPDEFEEVYNKWHNQHDAADRSAWEQTRIKCYYAIKPYLKGAISLKSFMPLPWDGKDKRQKAKDKSKNTGQKVHDVKRFNRLKKEYGG